MGDDIQEEDSYMLEVNAELTARREAIIRDVNFSKVNIQTYISNANIASNNVTNAVTIAKRSYEGNTAEFVNIVASTPSYVQDYNNAVTAANAIATRTNEYDINVDAIINNNIYTATAVAAAAASNANNTSLIAVAIRDTFTAHNNIIQLAIEARSTANNTNNIINAISNSIEAAAIEAAATAAIEAAAAIEAIEAAAAAILRAANASRAIVEGIVTSNINNINNATIAATTALSNAALSNAALSNADISTASQAAATAAATAARCLRRARIYVNATTNKYLEAAMLQYRLTTVTEMIVEPAVEPVGEPVITGTGGKKSNVQLAQEAVAAKQTAVNLAGKAVEAARKKVEKATKNIDTTTDHFNKCRIVTVALLNEYNGLVVS